MRLAGHMPPLLEQLCEGGGGEHKALCDVLMMRQSGGPRTKEADVMGIENLGEEATGSDFLTLLQILAQCGKKL